MVHEPCGGNLGRLVDVATVEEQVPFHECFEVMKIPTAEFVPLGKDDQGVCGRESKGAGKLKLGEKRGFGHEVESDHPKGMHGTVLGGGPIAGVQEDEHPRGSGMGAPIDAKGPATLEDPPEVVIEDRAFREDPSGSAPELGGMLDEKSRFR
jgi:hypothetical protein